MVTKKIVNISSPNSVRFRTSIRIIRCLLHSKTSISSKKKDTHKDSKVILKYVAIVTRVINTYIWAYFDDLLL